MPERIQLKRTRGWRMPASAVKVDRTTRWGNPFSVAQAGSVTAAVDAHARWMRGELDAPDGAAPPASGAVRAALAGRDLACWCRLDAPCHAELLLAIANGDPAPD